jgi:hypothetical protein
MEEFEAAQYLRDHGTADWLFHEDMFKQWVDMNPGSWNEDFQNLLWVKGNS